MRRALVVGGTRDTGLAVVHAMLDAEYSVVSVGRSALNFIPQIIGAVRSAHHIQMDMLRDGAVDELVKLVQHGGEPDIIVHVMGGSLGVKSPMASAAEFADVLRLNLGIAININRAFLPGMIARKWGRIVHLSSNATTLHIGAPAYTSAKHAVEGYVRTMGREYASTGVVISAVRPGPIFTAGRFLYSQPEEWTEEFQRNYVPAGRWGTPAELANVIAFLCSERASYMQGTIVDVDGGMR